METETILVGLIDELGVAWNHPRQAPEWESHLGAANRQLGALLKLQEDCQRRKEAARLAEARRWQAERQKKWDESMRDLLACFDTIYRR